MAEMNICLSEVNIMIKNIDFDYSTFGNSIFPPADIHERKDDRYLLHISAIRSGGVKIVKDGNTHYASEGNLFIIKGHSTHTLIFDENKDTWECWLDIWGKPPNKEVSESIEKLPLIMPLSQKVTKVLEAIILADAIQSAHKWEYERFLKEITHALLSLIFIEAQDLSSMRQNPIVLTAERYISQYYHTDLNLEKIATHCAITKQHLMLLFRKNSLPSPMSLVWDKRVNQAKELLRQTELKLSEIASQTGFKSVYHFSKKIKEYTTLSPLAFRKEARKIL